MNVVLSWIDLLARWVHLAAGIAWIGSSFYFVWLDRHLTAPSAADPRAEGELWMVHSGGFYMVQRRRLAGTEVPVTLHWFKWEAALTWATGMLLLAVVYYLTGGTVLLDPAVSTLSAAATTGIALGTLLVGWIGYHALWRSPLARGTALPTALSLVLLAALTYMLFRTMSGRAAYVHVGALLGSIMAANVWAVILPAQRQMIAATARGEPPNYALGERAKRRSLHNSYLTFPVLFMMLSTHFPQTYSHSLGWLILLLLTLAGVAARHAMIGNGSGRALALVPLAASLAAVIALTAPRAPSGPAASSESVPFAAVRDIVQRRCITCHSAFPTDRTFSVAPNGITFDTPDEIRRHAERIRERAAVQRSMPPANVTGITDAERDLLRRRIRF